MSVSNFSGTRFWNSSLPRRSTANFPKSPRGSSRVFARQFILANAFEALVGAIYLDKGYEAAKEFIVPVLMPYLKDILEKKLYKDSKSLFQEEAQDRVGITPAYEVLDEWGPDHDKHFVVGVYLGQELVAKGEGPSKQIAEAESARAGLHEKGWL